MAVKKTKKPVKAVKKVVAKVAAKKVIAKVVIKKVAPKKTVSKVVKKTAPKKVVAKVVSKATSKKMPAKTVIKVAPIKASAKVVKKAAPKKAAIKASTKVVIKSAPKKAAIKAIIKTPAKVPTKTTPKKVVAKVVTKETPQKIAEKVVDITEKIRYTDPELQEFKEIILKKLDDARHDLVLLTEAYTTKNDNDTNDTSPTFKVLEEGSNVLSKEENSQLASRQQKFIRDLENALLRIENKTYGICRVTGKLISKDRLRVVPHATMSIEAKLTLQKQKK
jgi:DnaK suppressor protein